MCRTHLGANIDEKRRFTTIKFKRPGRQSELQWIFGLICLRGRIEYTLQIETVLFGQVGAVGSCSDRSILLFYSLYLTRLLHLPEENKQRRKTKRTSNTKTRLTTQYPYIIIIIIIIAAFAEISAHHPFTDQHQHQGQGQGSGSGPGVQDQEGRVSITVCQSVSKSLSQSLSHYSVPESLDGAREPTCHQQTRQHSARCSHSAHRTRLASPR